MVAVGVGLGNSDKYFYNVNEQFLNLLLLNFFLRHQEVIFKPLCQPQSAAFLLSVKSNISVSEISVMYW